MIVFTIDKVKLGNQGPCQSEQLTQATMVGDNHSQSWNYPYPHFGHNSLPHRTAEPAFNAAPPLMTHPNIIMRSHTHPSLSSSSSSSSSLSVHPMTHAIHPNNTMRLNPVHPSPNFHPDHPIPIPPLYHSASSSSSNFPSNYNQPTQSSYPPPHLSHDFTENRREGLKRKYPVLPPTQASEHQPVNLNSSNWSSTHTVPTGGEISQRSVRIRRSYNLPPENNYNTHRNYFPSGTNVTGLIVMEQSNHFAQPRVYSADSGFLNHELSRYPVQNHATNNGTEMRGGVHFPAQNRNWAAPVPTPLPAHRHIQPARELGASSSSFTHSTGSYRSIPSPTYEPSRPVSSWQFSTEINAPTSHSRPVTVMGRNSNISINNSYNNERTRNYDNGLRSVLHEDNSTFDRWLFEHLVTAERQNVFEPRDAFDQHRDMRLDIDNMSYEELLALEERIGYVNTGLVDEKISKCLKETIHYSSNQSEGDHEQASCVICLEEYETGDNLGRLKCGHDFHSVCIRKWLEMKNVCPVCKSPAFREG